MALRPQFQAAAQQAQSEPGSEDDIEAVKGMARLFAELGESYVGLLAQGALPYWQERTTDAVSEHMHGMVCTFVNANKAECSDQASQA